MATVNNIDNAINAMVVRGIVHTAMANECMAMRGNIEPFRSIYDQRYTAECIDDDPSFGVATSQHRGSTANIAKRQHDRQLADALRDWSYYARTATNDDDRAFAAGIVARIARP